MEIEKIKTEIRKILKEELKDLPYKFFFFGSRVAGTASPRSDLDVGVEGEVSIPKEKLLSIKSRIEAIPTLYQIDLVDFALISEEFKKVAKQHIEEIE